MAGCSEGGTLNPIRPWVRLTSQGAAGFLKGAGRSWVNVVARPAAGKPTHVGVTHCSHGRYHWSPSSSSLWWLEGSTKTICRTTRSCTTTPPRREFTIRCQRLDRRGATKNTLIFRRADQDHRRKESKTSRSGGPHEGEIGGRERRAR